MASPRQPTPMSYQHQRIAAGLEETYATGENEMNLRNNNDDDNERPYGQSRGSVKGFVFVMKVFFLVSVTGCLVLSKLTMVEIFARYGQLVNLSSPEGKEFKTQVTESLKEASRVYWQLLLIVMVPSCLSWLYCLFTGVLSRSSNHRWPSKPAIAFGIVLAVLESVAEIVLYYVVFISIPPEAVIFVMSGVFSVQGLFNVYFIVTAQSIYEPIGGGGREGITPAYIRMSLKVKVFLISIMFLGVVLQVFGVISVGGFIAKADRNMITIGCLAIASLLVLSFVWTNSMQKMTFHFYPKNSENATKVVSSARWRAGFISSTTRLLLYPVVSYCIVRFFYQVGDSPNAVVDPWCIPYITELNIKDVFTWSYHDSSVFGVHIVASFVSFIIQGVSCYMTLHLYGLALPTFLATPISIGIYFVSNSPVDIRRGVNLYLFPFSNKDRLILDWTHTITSQWHILMFTVAIGIWVGQIFITSHNLMKSKNVILASVENMFIRPYYNSVLLEQYQSINRYVTISPTTSSYDSDVRKPSMVFICSTMYRENSTEMRQLLKSLHGVAEYSKRQRSRQDTFESHIFFDGGCHGDDLSQFAIQLMSLVPDTMRVDLTKGNKQMTPYGYRFSWKVENCMPFVIHFKDNQKIKNKKRWSQVMYMNYILHYREESDGLDLSNTYILTTDADIKFQAEAVIVLLDMLARDSQVGAVCARTHPLGYGLLYWYQIFDYAIGHWLQKGAEHILGSVLCCPGCFSMFRCVALKDCLKTYSTEVDNATEFLMKDMGEDRWLCTLLVEKKWRLEYCAISNNYTYCPVEFDEFFKQRRRWIPSTLANLWLLVSRGSKMTKNVSIGWLFIIYQAFIIISTVIAPATVILIIASGLQASFSFNAIAVIVTLILVAIGYGLVCIYAGQQTQLDVAKVLTFFFSVVMAVVVVGILKQILKDIFQSDDSNESGGNNRLNNSSYILPVGETTIYVGLFACIFVASAILHYKEFFTLFHCLWYLLGLPSGYLLLLIYSTANLNSRSWGTREKSDNSQGVLGIVWTRTTSIFKKFLVKVGLWSNNDGTAAPQREGPGEAPPPRDPDEPKPKGKRQAIVEGGGGGLEGPRGVMIDYPWLRGWLKEHGCEKFYDHFANDGYTEEWLLVGVSEQNLRDIGIQPEGYVRHLMKAIKKLPLHQMHAGIPKTIREWIDEDLGLARQEDEYNLKFHNAGYFGLNDVENLQQITREELIKDIGVYKKGHIKRFTQGLKNLKFPSKEEEKITEAQFVLQLTNDQSQAKLDDKEVVWWYELLDRQLHPIPEALSQTTGLKEELRNLRNSVLVAFLLINLIWIILLYVLTIEQLKHIGLDSKFLSLAFLAVYGVILLVQFLAMMFHRIVTLSHYISRLSQSLPVEVTYELTQTTRNL